VLSPDGSTVVFASDRAGASTLIRAPLNGIGGERVLYRHDGGGVYPWSWSADGRYVLASADDPRGRPIELMLVPVDGGAPIRIPNPDGIAFVTPRLSPRGDFVAFMNRTQSPQEVIVMSVAGGHRVRVATDGGTNPVWGPDGDLYFHSSGTIMRVPMKGMIMGQPQPLFRPCESLRRRFANFGSELGYDLSADGTRFLVICAPADAAPSGLTVLVNWQSKLR
jgi:Tol biopolymer transport system component